MVAQIGKKFFTLMNIPVLVELVWIEIILEYYMHLFGIIKGSLGKCEVVEKEVVFINLLMGEQLGKNFQKGYPKKWGKQMYLFLELILKEYM